jgi:arogenate dehydrogenase (NADP+)
MWIGIVGLGLIGGSLGLDLRAQGKTVWGVSRSRATCEMALRVGAVDIASTQLADIPHLQETAVVFVCTPIDQVLSTVQVLAEHLHPLTVITDVASVKGAIVQSAQAMYSRFVGCHPMAGSEVQGIKGAQKHLFVDRPCVICPAPDPEAIAVVQSLWASLGMRIYYCDPHTHDQAVARISHLPVMVGASLIHACQQGLDPTVQYFAQKLASSGFRDTTRVGGGNPELGTMMARFNREALQVALAQYQQQIEHLSQLIADQNWSAVQNYLENAQKWRSLFG